MRNLPHGFDIHLVNVKNMRKIAQIFVAFSEKLNLKLAKNDHFHEGGKVGRSNATPIIFFSVDLYVLKSRSFKFGNNIFITFQMPRVAYIMSVGKINISLLFRPSVIRGPWLNGSARRDVFFPRTFSFAYRAGWHSDLNDQNLFHSTIDAPPGVPDDQTEVPFGKLER